MAGNEVAGTDILGAVKAALQAEFGEEAAVYAEIPMQGASLPYIYVQPAETRQARQGNGVIERVYGFDVACFPQDARATQNREMGRVQARLLDCLGCIAVDGRALRAGENAARIEEGALHVAVSYALRLIAADAEAAEEMQGLDYSVEIGRER